jgi:hypothetical protein
MHALNAQSPADRARHVRASIPREGLFQGHDWRISPDPFPLSAKEVTELESLGRVLLQFYRALNLLYQQSAAGKQPAWVARWLDQGKPAELIDLQRAPAFKGDVPRVIRPDVLLTDDGFRIVELDSVPGGIGLTAWLNRTYSEFHPAAAPDVRKGIKHRSRLLLNPESSIVGGADGMLHGFGGIFENANQVQIVVSDEAGTYRPEMEWLADQLGRERFKVRDGNFMDFAKGDAVYRFFEMFDVPNVGNANRIFDLAREKKITVTSSPKPVLEEKMMFALLCNRNLQGFWRQQLGGAFYQRLLKVVPYSWLVDPAPLPPHGAIPELNLTDWRQLKEFSQRERDLILKISGFSAEAWGARGVYLGSDLSSEEWSLAVEKAIDSFSRTPYVLQRFDKPKLVQTSYYDFETNEVKPMPGRARLCPFYFVLGEGDAARAHLGGVLATICPADKKIIHGMKDAVLTCCIQTPPENP